MENNVGEVNNMISNLRNMAIDMGNEIGGQNRQIGRVNDKVRLCIHHMMRTSTTGTQYRLYFIAIDNFWWQLCVQGSTLWRT